MLKALKENGFKTAVISNCFSEECLYVGDGGSDELKAAKEVGMNPVQATWYLQEGLNQPTGSMQEFRQAKEPMDIARISGKI